jgi:hypothetical protein
MRKRIWSTAAAICAMGIAISASGSEFRTFGARSLSMGGASVARPEPSVAVYYNPGALATDERCGLSLLFGLDVRETGIADRLETLSDMNWDNAIDNPEGPEAAAIIAEILQIESYHGVLVNVNILGIGARSGPVGVGVLPTAQVGIHANIDKTHSNMTHPAVDPLSFANNTSTLFAQGLGMVEVPIGYGYQFDTGHGVIGVGGAVKFIQALTYDVEETVTSIDDDIMDTLRNSEFMTTGFGIDFGAHYVSPDGKLAVGLLLRNVNSPDFETILGRSFTEDMQVRMGVAYDFSEVFGVALDFDITANETLISDHSSRQIGGGMFWKPCGYLELRGGLMTNTEAEDSRMLFTAGLQLGGDGLFLDLAGAMAGEQHTLEDFTFPAEGSFVIAIGGRW